MNGFGGMVTTETLTSLPILFSHTGYSAEELKRAGVDEGMVRAGGCGPRGIGREDQAIVNHGIANLEPVAALGEACVPLAAMAVLVLAERGRATVRECVGSTYIEPHQFTGAPRIRSRNDRERVQRARMRRREILLLLSASIPLAGCGSLANLMAPRSSRTALIVDSAPLPNAPWPATPMTAAHSHNDYEQRRPLLDSLALGYRSVEADIWLRDGELRVSHQGRSFAGTLREV